MSDKRKRWTSQSAKTAQAITQGEQVLKKARELAETDPEAARRLLEQAEPALRAAQDQNAAALAETQKAQEEVQDLLDRLGDDN